MSKIAIFCYASIAVAALRFAAYGTDLSDLTETVTVKGQDGSSLLINKSDFDKDQASASPKYERLDQPEPSAVAASGSAPVPVASAPSGGNPVEYADPASGEYFVAQIGTRFFVTDKSSRRYQKGQSAAGYDTQEAAQAAAAKMIAAAQAGGAPQ